MNPLKLLSIFIVLSVFLVAGAVAEFGACGNEDAAALHILTPGDPVFDKGMDALVAGGCFEGGDNDLVRKVPRGIRQNLDLQVLF